MCPMNCSCTICSQMKSIESHRSSAVQALQVQAESMLRTSKRKYKPCDAGTNVLVKIPDVDRGRCAHRNIMGVVLSLNEHNLYKIGTAEGVLDKLYARNEIKPCDSNFLTIDDIKIDKNIALRSAAASLTQSKQGFVSCNCQKGCSSRSCKCKKSGVICSSKCHNNAGCRNK